MRINEQPVTMNAQTIIWDCHQTDSPSIQF